MSEYLAADLPAGVGGQVVVLQIPGSLLIHQTSAVKKAELEEKRENILVTQTQRPDLHILHVLILAGCSSPTAMHTEWSQMIKCITCTVPTLQHVAW